jgi:glutamyl-tRNA reductase
MGHLVVVGLSHHMAPLDLRQRLAFDAASWRSAVHSFRTVLLSTCNRVEVYAWAEKRPAACSARLERALARAAEIKLDDLRPHLTRAVGQEAVLHLIRVAAGLDSLIVGEDQIRGQVRVALRDALLDGPAVAPLRGVFERAAESARRIRGATQLAKQPSIAAAGVHVLARVVPNGLAGKPAVVLGAGVIARSALEALLAQDADVHVLNRTPEHAQRVVAHFGRRVRVSGLDALPAALEEADVVIGATASQQPIVDESILRASTQRRGGRPLVLLDMAVPRDIDARARSVPGVWLIDLDDLERECPLDIADRRAELERAEELARQEAERLTAWLRLRAAGPDISELRGYAEQVRASELRRSAQPLKDLTPEQAAAVEALTAGIVNKLLHGPTVALRDASMPSRSRRRILCLMRPPQGRSA